MFTRASSLRTTYFQSPPRVPEPAWGPCPALGTCVNPVVRLQLVLEAEFLATSVALVGLLPSVDALVALECALVPEAAATELTLVWVVTCEDRELTQILASSCLCFRDSTVLSVS